MAPRAERGHRLAAHTADVIIEAWGPTRAACLEEVVGGVVATFADTSDARPTGPPVDLDLGAAPGADAIVALVDELCLLLDAEGLVVVEVTVTEGDGGTRATLRTAPIAAVECTGAAPKGVSRSDLQLETDGARWHARAIVDV
jgi:SHS2 domain-containing protein